MNHDATDIFHDAPVISTYTVEQAVQDGTLIDARKLPGEAGKMIRDRYNGHPVYLSSGLDALINTAVENKKAANDLPGVIWDIINVAGGAIKQAVAEAQREGSGFGSFQVIITGTGRKKLHQIFVTLDGNGLTFMLPEDY